MPKVSDAYREARRTEIVEATLRVIARNGLRSLTVAQIIDESGLSAGSVYSHFTNKGELIELVATKVIGERVDRLTAESDDPPHSPTEVVRWWLTELERDGAPFGAALQMWGEGAADPDVQAIIRERMASIEDAFAAAALRWLTATGGEVGRAREVARAMLTFCQGYVVRTALLGPQDIDGVLGGVEFAGA